MSRNSVKIHAHEKSSRNRGQRRSRGCPEIAAKNVAATLSPQIACQCCSTNVIEISLLAHVDYVFVSLMMPTCRCFFLSLDYILPLANFIVIRIRWIQVSFRLDAIIPLLLFLHANRRERDAQCGVRAGISVVKSCGAFNCFTTIIDFAGIRSEERFPGDLEG